MANISVLLIAILVLLQLFDFWSTHFLLTHGGRETNPVLLRLQQVLMGTGGPWLWLIVAKGVPLLLVLIGWPLDWWGSSAGIVVLALLDAFYCYMMIGNWKEVRRYQ